MTLPRLEVPTYQINLPSTNKPITFRPFLVKEHKLLLTLQDADDVEVSRVIKDLISVCTFEKLDVNEMPHFDVEYLFMNLRAKSLGEMVDVIITCSNCDEKYDATFNIENLKIEKNEGASNRVKIADSTVLEFRYPSFDNVISIFDSQDVDKILNLICDCLVGIFHNENFYETRLEQKEEVKEFLLSLTKEQFEKIEKYFEDSPKVVQVVETDCPSCKTHNTSRIEGLRNFFV